MALLGKKKEETFRLFEERITRLARNIVPEGQSPTFKDGCDFLLQWYHSMVSSLHS
jgi:hypothetical protein